MTLLLDTHILVWTVLEPGRLTSAQHHAVRTAQADGEPLGISAVTLREIARHSAL